MIERAEKRDVFRGQTEAERRLQSTPQTNFYRDWITERQRGKSDGDINPTRVNSLSPASFSGLVKAEALNLGVTAVGITAVTQDYAYKDQFIPGRYAISLAMKMDSHKVCLAPSPEAEEEFWRVYYELGEATIKLAEFIRALGYPSFAHHPLRSGRLLQVPFAVMSGIARLGRLGVAISPKVGPRMRLSCVTTDLTLAVDPAPLSHRAEYCDHCLACYRACPARAIARELTNERRIERYVLDWQRCRSYSNYHNGCGICLKICPYDRVMTWDQRSSRTIGASE